MKSPVDTYQSNLSTYQQQLDQLQKADKQTSFVRLLIALVTALLGYQWIDSGHLMFAAGMGLALITFMLLVKKHASIRWTIALTREKIAINQKELDYHQHGALNFENGEEFVKTDHAYAYDLDFFGKNSLFQLLNRTGTINGKRKLANSLLTILPKKSILKVQEAIKELTPHLEWRQHVLALATMQSDSEEHHQHLIAWARKKAKASKPIIRVASFLLPALTLIFLTLYFIDSNELAGRLGGLLCLINLGMLAGHSLSIKSELMDTTEIEKVLKQYALLLNEIEHHDFQSKGMVELKDRLEHHRTKASTAIHELALLFGRLEHVSNAFASPLLNGLLQYHIHVLHGLNKWRANYASHIEEWLDVIGEAEQLSSLANFYYNHPDFSIPEINEDRIISFEGLGHPLIANQESVTNDISFGEQRFFILTGSNMSGKSTFLRSLGVNMVLAGIGAPVFAKNANIHPMTVLVSMRLSDSLTDSESYFYAEVKRLKYIMERLKKESCFVLLDEILRGTNSDDKRNGTMEVIRNMAKTNVFGGIATHDLEVCNVTNEFPEVLTNKRFEVEIKNNELVFDYKLRDGICENKSATFIMKKLGVI